MAVTMKQKSSMGSMEPTDQPRVTFVPVKKSASKKQKQEDKLVQTNALAVDDEFEGYYFHPLHNAEAEVLYPPYQPKTLAALRQENNALGQLIAAMEINIDGTGQEVLKKETKEPDASSEIDEFFEEVFPGMSFTTLRRLIRRDEETYGYAYMEVVRNIPGDIVFLRHIDACTMRMVRLDDPTLVEKKVMRGKKEVKYQMMCSERRFMQMSGGQKVFFKEYGSSRRLNKETGKWESEDNPVPDNMNATEVLMFMINKDVETPYGVPRWINQIPSLLGSRKAEELNLDFFNAGGLPPALFIVQGGVMTKEVRKQIHSYLSGKGGTYNRAGIVEVHATGADLTGGGSVKVSVERFGAERQNDSMFENYDMKCEQRVRSSFRLPTVFVGRTNDNTYASVFASYTVAEAQVFGPERQEFDEKMNTTIIRELSKKHIIRSKPLVVRDTTMILQGLTLAKDAVDNENLVKAVNEAINTEMAAKEDEEPMETGIVPTEQGALAEPATGGKPVPGQQAAAAAEQTNPAGNKATPTRAPTAKKHEEVLAALEKLGYDIDAAEQL